MALKDWKKVDIGSSNRKVWKNKKTKKYLDIIEVYPVVPMGTNSKPVFKVRPPERRDYKSGFKTKSQALKFAKNYMKKH